MPAPFGKRPTNCFRDPKSPFWQYDFSIQGERERGSTRRSSASEAAAFVENRKALMRKKHAAMAMGIVTPTVRHISLFDACERFKEQFKNIDKTTELQVGNLAALLCSDGRDRMLHEITTADFADYRTVRARNAAERGRPISGATINREIELARRIWLYAAALDFEVGKMPNWTKVIDKTAERERNRELRADEEQRLFEALRRINPDLALMAEFAMLTGQRKKAVVRLRWKDVDLVGREAKFTMKTRGENKREHSVPLTARMIGIIKMFPKIGPFVFTYECRRNAPRRRDRPARIRGERFPFSVQGWTRQWRAALREARIDDFRWHDLRHTAASRLLRSVHNLKMVQELLGHQSIDQTARYAHITKTDLRRALEQADNGAKLTAVGG